MRVSLLCIVILLGLEAEAEFELPWLEGRDVVKFTCGEGVGQNVL